MDSKVPKQLHGNNARINPGKNVTSLYQENMAAVSPKKARFVSDEAVTYVRRFSEENKK